MNRFFKVVVGGVVILSVSATLALADSRGQMNGDRNGVRHYEGDRGRGGNHRNEVPGMYNHPRNSYPYYVGDRGPGAVQVGVGVLEPTPPLLSIFGVIIVGPSTGHWENRIVGYQTVMRPVYHPQVLGLYWNGFQYIQYVVVPERWGPELEPIQEPIYQRVWVSP